MSDRFAAPVVAAALVANDESAVSPREAESALRARRIAPANIEEITVASWLSNNAKSVPQFPQLESAVKALLAETSTLFRAIRWCMDSAEWDFSACIFPGIRRCHELAAWLEGISDTHAVIGRTLLAGCYEHHDMLLGQLIDQVGDVTHVIALTLHGPDVRQLDWSQNATLRGHLGTPTRDFGLAVMIGPGVRFLEAPLNKSVLDLAPTILTMLGTAYGKDMDGRPILECFDTDIMPKAADTWETTRLPSGMEEQSCDAEATAESFANIDADPAVEHLVTLGYVDPYEIIAMARLEQARRGCEINRADSLLDAGLAAQAIRVLEQVIREHPDSYRSHALLAELYFRTDQRQQARREIEGLMIRGFEKPQLYLLLAAVECVDRQFDRALVDVRCASRAGLSLTGARVLEGEIQLRRRDFDAAEEALKTALRTDGPTVKSLDGLAAVYLHRGRYEEAATAALDALAQDLHVGRAHYHLAVALHKLGNIQAALQALQTWANVEPMAAAPYRWLARLCEDANGDRKAAARFRDQGREVVRRRRVAKRSARAANTSAP